MMGGGPGAPMAPYAVAPGIGSPSTGQPPAVMAVPSQAASSANTPVGFPPGPGAAPIGTPVDAAAVPVAPPTAQTQQPSGFGFGNFGVLPGNAPIGTPISGY
jgi:hypothetical protein